MVQLPTFSTFSYKIERKMGKKLFNSYQISKNLISKFSGRLLIGQNDSLEVLLLDDFFLRIDRNDLTHTF